MEKIPLQNNKAPWRWLLLLSLINTVLLVAVLVCEFIFFDFGLSFFPEPKQEAAVVQPPTPTLTPTPTPDPWPVKINIPKLNVDTNIVVVGYDLQANQMEIPKNASEVGWYNNGPVPGVPGASVLSAHYDTPTGQAGVFYNLQTLSSGDEFFITNNSNQKIRFVVEQVQDFPLDSFPKDLIYGERDYSQVSLLTCAGVWNPNVGLYSRRLAVVAKQDAAYMEKGDLDIVVASAEKKSEQLLAEGFLTQENKRIGALGGVYLRLELEDGQLLVFLATDNQAVAAVDAVMQFDPAKMDLDTANTLVSDHFGSYLLYSGEGNITLSLFTDPGWQIKEPFNSQDKEVKIAQIPYRVNEKLGGVTKINLTHDVKEQKRSAVLQITSEEGGYKTKNILDITQGAWIVE